MVAAPNLVHCVDAGNELGEGVLWNHARQTAWWTDIERLRLYEFDPLTGRLDIRETPYRVACFGFIDDSDSLIVAFDRGIAIYDPETSAVDWMVEPGFLPAGIRLNDGKVDSRGRFWVGSFVEDSAAAPGTGALYCLDPRAGLVECISDVICSNGLCWSPDDSVMYHADSPRHAIHAWRFEADTGAIDDCQVFARTPPGIEPDGSTVDAGGGVWNAQWGGGRVVRYDPAGEVSLVIETPMRQPSCVAFGGRDLDLLFVTSACVGLSEARRSTDPADGCLLVYQTSFTGLPTPYFRPDTQD